MSSSSTPLPPEASDPATIGPKPAIFTCIWLPVQILFVSLRYYSRSISRVSWGLDDVLVLISLVLQISIAALTLDEYANGGLGHHFLYLVYNFPSKATIYLKDNFAISLISILAGTIPRLAMLVLYRRLFVNKYVRICVYILVGILAIGAAVYITVVLLMCIPMSANWDFTITDYKCIDVVALQIWTSFPSIVIDIWMLVLPLPVIWRLHADRSLRVGLTLTLLVGSFGLITAIIRFAMFLRINSPDRSCVAADLLIWVQVESGCYLISACLPVCRPLLERLSKSRILQLLKEIVRSLRILGWRNGRSGPSEIQLQTAGKGPLVDVNGPAFYGLGNVGQGLESQSTEATRSEGWDLEGQLRGPGVK